MCVHYIQNSADKSQKTYVIPLMSSTECKKNNKFLDVAIAINLINM
jgi:hypothetical protein